MSQHKALTAFMFFLVTSLFVPLDVLTQNAHAEMSSSEFEIIDEMKSWYFYNINNSTITIFGNPTLETGLVGNALKFNGKDHVVVASNETEITLTDFTLSAWIKPNYTRSPTDMTVLNSKNAFDLAITTQDKKHTVQFSILNGFRWVSVRSETEISEDWTNIVATYNGTAINIYLDGKLDASTSLLDTLHYYAYGKEVLKIDGSKIRDPVLSSDIFIGGTQSKKDVARLFSGQIDEVQFYLTPSSILEGIPKIKMHNDYLLNATSCAYDASVQCSMQLSFQTSDIMDNRAQATFDHGIVSINGVDYTIKSKDWRGTIPINSGHAVFSGLAISSDNKEIRVIIVGNFLENTLYGHLYRLSGSVMSANLKTDLFGSFELVSSTNLYEEKIPPVIEKPPPPKILLMTKPFQSAFVKDYFRFDLKVYYFDKNPFKDYYQQGFEIQNATVSLQIVSPTGTILKQFDGLTDNNGYFSGEFIVPPNTAPGLYSIISSATKGESSDSNSFSLLISEQPKPSTSTEVNPDWPTIILNGTNLQTINKNAPYVELGATATDPEDGNLTASIIIDSSSVDTSIVGSYSVVYTVTDSAGNSVTESRTVMVVAGSPPLIILIGTNPQIINKNSPYVELGATASDPEDGDISGAIVIDSNAINTLIIGTYSVTYTVTDSSGNTDTKTRTVNVISGDSPIISLVGANPQTVEAGVTYTELGATASDPEDGNISDAIIIDSSAVNTSVIGSYNVTYSIMDSSGNSAHTIRIVNVVDTASPVITLVGAIPQTINKNSPYVELGATASDNYDGNISSAIIIDSSAVNTSVIGSYNVTYSVSDSSGNLDIKSRTVNVVTGSAPSITLSGINPQTVEAGVTYTELGATASDPEDGNISGAIIIDSSAVNTSVIGSYNVTYSVSDSSGNSDSESRTVSVVDTINPVITLSGSNPQTLPVSDAYVELGATASDNYDGNISGAIIIDSSAVNTSVIGSYNVTYSVSDSSGNSDIKSRIVSVVDTINPVITLSGSNPQTINKNSPYAELGATASDNYDGDISGAIIIDSSAVNTSVIGSYNVTYSVSDSSGNSDIKSRIVNVVTGGVPIITLSGTNPQTIFKTHPYVELGAIASDPEDGNISGAIIINSSSINTAIVGNYTVTYTVIDSSGNSDSNARIVMVISGTLPSITLTGTNPQTINVGDAYVDLGATASDPEDGNISGGIIIDSSAVNTSVLGNYPVTYTVTDSSSNTASTSRTVTVIDALSPIITLNGANPQTVVKNYPYAELGATASDNYDGNISGVIIIDSSTVNTSVIGSYNVTYSVSDSSGNSDIKSRTVNVVTSNSPIISLIGANPQTVDVGSLYVELGATATDAEDGNLTASIVIDSSAVNTSIVNTYSVNYTVTDISGNTDTRLRVVNVTDTSPPTITLLGSNPQIIEVGDPYAELGAAASDNYDGNLTASILIDSSSVNTSVIGNYTAIYQVYDSSGNDDVKTRTVSVTDTTPPVITLVGANPQMIVKNYPYVEYGATAFDSHSGNLTSSILINATAVNPGVIGNYSVIYSVSDSAGNQDAESRTVLVEPGNLPIITLLGPDPQRIDIGSLYVEFGATALDVEDGNLTSVIVMDASAVDVFLQGTYFVNYTVSDLSNNTDTKSRTIRVIISNQNLVDGLGIKDSVTNTVVTTESLTERLGLVGSTVATTSSSKSLSENLGLKDSVSKTTATTKSLSEDLGLKDNISKTTAITKLVTEKLGMTDTALGPVFYMKDSGIVAYRGGSTTTISQVGQTDLDTPKIRIWSDRLNGGSGGFDTEHALLSAGSPVNSTVVKYSPRLVDRIVLVTQTFNNTIVAYVCDSTCGNTNNWSGPTTLGSVPAGSAQRKFDLDFESRTGEALVVWASTSTNTAQDLEYATLANNTSTWSSTGFIDETTNVADAAYTWIDIERNPNANSNEIIIAGFESITSDVPALIWNGETNSIRSGSVVDISTTATQMNGNKGFAVAYTSDGTKGMVAAPTSGTFTGGVNARFWTSSTAVWTTMTAASITGTGNDNPYWLTMKADPTSSKLFVTMVDSANDVNVMEYSGAGTTWSTPVVDITASLDVIISPDADFAYNATKLTGTTLSNGRINFDDTVVTATATKERNCKNTATCAGSNTSTIIGSATGTGLAIQLYTNTNSTSSIDVLGLRLTSSRDLGAFAIRNTNTATPYTNYGETAISSETVVRTGFGGFSFDFKH